MQYLSQVDIVTSLTETSVFMSKDERLTCLNLKSVCWETISSLISYHQISCTLTSLFVSSSAASSIVETWHAHASCRWRELQERLERKTSYAKKHSKKRRRFWIKYDYVFHSICWAESERDLNWQDESEQDLSEIWVSKIWVRSERDVNKIKDKDNECKIV